MPQVNEPHVQYEYDSNFFGGDCSGEGYFVYVPITLVEKLGGSAALFNLPV